MGLIVLFFIALFLLAIGLIFFIYIKTIRSVLRMNISKKIKPFLLIGTLPILCIPIYLLYIFAQSNSDMIYMSGFFGLAPKTSQNIELNTSKGKLNFIIELDFNTGARGGASIDNSFFYLTNGKKKEILITEHEIHMGNRFYKEALKTEKIAAEIESHKYYGKYYFDLYFSPKLFSLEEFEQISDFLKHNHKILSKKINNYKENQKSKVYNKTLFRNTYYQDVNSLKKIYNCTNNLQLHLTATGRLFYITKSDISTSYNDIGDVKDNGHKLLLDKYVNLSEKSGKYQIYRGNTLIKECFDNNGTNLFEEFQLEKI